MVLMAESDEERKIRLLQAEVKKLQKYETDRVKKERQITLKKIKPLVSRIEYIEIVDSLK